MPKITLLLFWLILGCFGFAQKNSRYVFTRIGKSNGLASDIPFSVCQDKDGFIWISSDNGLQRYDGYRFLSFRKELNDSSGLPGNLVKAVAYEKNRDLLWIQVNDNILGTFDPHSFKYTPVKISLANEPKKFQLINLNVDHRGLVNAMLVGYGVITYNEKANEFSNRYNIIETPDSSHAGTIDYDSIRNGYWLANTKGMYFYDLSSKLFVPTSQDPVLTELTKKIVNEHPDGPVSNFTDKFGNFWCNIWSYTGAYSGADIIKYSPAKQAFIAYHKSILAGTKGYYTINGILHQRNGDVWIYGSNLFEKYNKEKDIFEDVRNQYLVQNNVDIQNISKLYEDREENIWIASSNGLYLFNPGSQVFSNIPHHRDDVNNSLSSSTSVFQSVTSKNFYLTAWGGGLFGYDPDINPLTISSLTATINMMTWSVLDRLNGEMWLGMQGGEVKVYPKLGQPYKSIFASAIGKRTVRQVVEDSKGNIWFGTQGGYVVKCINANWREPEKSFVLMQKCDANIMAIWPDGDVTWVATDGFGLYKLNSEDGRVLDIYSVKSEEGKRLERPYINDILKYDDTTLLIASGNLQLLNTKTNRITNLAITHGLPQANVTTIIKDRLGYVWLGSDAGVTRFTLTGTLVNTFSHEDGINNDYIEPNSGALLQDGKIVFGTSTDMLIVDPEKLIDDYFKPTPIIISEFKVFDKSLRTDSILKLPRLVLPYTDNSISLNLSTLTYTQNYQLNYMLEGIDKTWKKTTTGDIVYSYLAPGTYTFKAKSSSGTDSAVTELVIDIQPPFWQRWWFYGLLILSGILIFYLIDRERMMRLRATENVRRDIALNLHQEISTTLNNINLLSEMARIKADKDLARSKEMIDQITNKSNHMMVAMDDVLWSIDPENDSVEKMMLRMTEFTESLRNNYKAKIVFKIDERIKRLRLDMKQRHGFFLIFKEALQCIVQNLEGRNTLVEVDLVKGKLLLKMHDGNINTDHNAEAAQCISAVKKYAEPIHSELDFQVDKAGANIVLVMPLK